jgi:excisionase family DNA binding protein
MLFIEPQKDEVMNYRGLSEYTKFAQGTLRHKVMRGEIPYIKIGRSVRFTKKDINAWLEKQAIAEHRVSAVPLTGSAE